MVLWYREESGSVVFGVFFSGVVLWYRQRCVSVLFVMYFLAVWNCDTESGLLVC